MLFLMFLINKRYLVKSCNDIGCTSKDSHQRYFMKDIKSTRMISFMGIYTYMTCRRGSLYLNDENNI